MNQRLLVELDALLDTRLATVSMIDQDAALAIMDDNYRERDFDVFSYIYPGFDDAAYTRRYQRRDWETLSKARPTVMAFILAGICQRMGAEIATGSPTITAAEVHINCYPYDLTGEERDLICVAVQKRSGFDIRVTTVDIPHYELNTHRIAGDEYSALIIYNFKDWFECAFATPEPPPREIPSVTVYAPMLYQSKEALAESIVQAEEVEECKDPHVALRAVMSNIIGLDFSNVDQFSIV